MGMAESDRGNYETAKKIFEDGVNIFKGMRNINFQLVLRSEIGHIERHTGNLLQAKSIYQETIKDWQVLGNRSAIAHQLECFGILAITEQQPQRAIKLFGAAEALRERIQSPMIDIELIETEFNALWAEGRLMTMEQAIQLALR
jgi:hypothetical protein